VQPPVTFKTTKRTRHNQIQTVRVPVFKFLVRTEILNKQNMEITVCMPNTATTNTHMLNRVLGSDYLG